MLICIGELYYTCTYFQFTGNRLMLNLPFNHTAHTARVYTKRERVVNAS